MLMPVVLLVLVSMVAAFFAVRYFMLRNAVRKIDEELGEVSRHLGDNRIVKLPYPDKRLEGLLETVNATLSETRRKAVEFAGREADLKMQIEHISHDLRTPLTAMLGYLSLIDEGELGDTNLESLETVRRKAGSLQRLIVRFYELSRIQAEELELDSKPVDIGRMLRESTMGQYRLLSDRGLEVTVSIPDHQVVVLADGDAMERVFSNLLQNAGSYAKSLLRVSLEQDGGRVTVRFDNDVESFDIGNIEQLFQPFYTVDSSRSQAGSGLGLAIARHLVERMGGTLDAFLDDEDGFPRIRFEATMTSTAV